MQIYVKNLTILHSLLFSWPDFLWAAAPSSQ